MYRLLVLFILLSSPALSAANSLKGWPQGPHNYKAIHDIAVKEEKPLLVYFYTDWCPYCKRLNSEYIASPEFKKLFSGIYRVQINPEKSKSGEILFKKKYKGTGFPAVFVYVPGVSQEPRQFHPFSKKGDWSPAEYTKKIREQIARGYSKKAYELYKDKKYKRARGYLIKASTYDLKNKYALLLMGSIYHKEGYENQDKVLLNKARHIYKKILKIYPGDKKALSALEKLGN